MGMGVTSERATSWLEERELTIAQCNQPPSFYCTSVSRHGCEVFTKYVAKSDFGSNIFSVLSLHFFLF